MMTVLESLERIYTQKQELTYRATATICGMFRFFPVSKIVFDCLLSSKSAN
jgi:hypothetical protein